MEFDAAEDVVRLQNFFAHGLSSRLRPTTVAYRGIEAYAAVQRAALQDHKSPDEAENEVRLAAGVTASALASIAQ